MNLIIFMYSLLTVALVLLMLLANTIEKYLPTLTSQILRYDEFASKNKPIFKIVRVPKAWYVHFQAYGSVLTLSTTFYLACVFLLNVEVPLLVYDLLDFIGGSSRSANISNTRALLVVILLVFQCVRRLHDFYFIYVFVKNTVSLLHYFVGYTHYTSCVLAVLLETSEFVRSTGTADDIGSNLSSLTYVDAIGIVLFFWAWTHQYKAHVILGNLRKDTKGNVLKTEAHKLRHGHWFDYVSSPHRLSEILSYFALTIILRNSVTWIILFVWVFTNQVVVALLAHWWYKRNFENVPKSRKAIIPFVY